jgi:hypothetical protein
MTPAGRPPRSSSSSKKTITIRVTEEEHALLTKAASPYDLSYWIRNTLFASPEVVALREPATDEPPDAIDLRAAMAMFDLQMRTAAEAMTPEKQKQAAELQQSLRGLVGLALKVAGVS